jgi:Mrp family chromosome partitioning ATPase
MSTPTDNLIPLFNRNTALTAGAQRTISTSLTCNLSVTELTKLYQAIETALPDKPRRIVQFVSAYENEGTSTVGFETAVIVATLGGKRVLFIDTGAKQEGAAKHLADAVTVSLDTFLQINRPLSDAFVAAGESNLVYTVLRNQDLAMVSLDGVQRLFEDLRQSFDLIIVDSSAILTNVVGLAIAKLVDGSILVVEAERTRAPVAMQTKRVLVENGGNIIGAVLNKRKLYIPRWVYRWLYR